MTEGSTTRHLGGIGPMPGPSVATLAVLARSGPPGTTPGGAMGAPKRRGPRWVAPALAAAAALVVGLLAVATNVATASPRRFPRRGPGRTTPR